MKLGVAFGYSIRGAMLATFIVFNSQCANAQVQTALTDPTYLAVTSTSNPGGICGPPYCVNPNQGISLDYFQAASTALNSSSFDSQFNAINSQISALGNQTSALNGQLAALTTQTAALNSQVSAFSNQVSALNNQISKSLEIAAIAAAMGDAIPAPGDRFAIRINAAGFDRYGAGAIGLRVRTH